MASKLVFHQKVVHEDGSIVEVKIWQVPKSVRSPDGVKYFFYLVKGGKVLVGYDNHHPKGHHRHYGDRQEPYPFTSIEQLAHDFNEDRKRCQHENQND